MVEGEKAEHRRLLSEPPLPQGLDTHMAFRAPPGQVAIAPLIWRTGTPQLGFYQKWSLRPCDSFLKAFNGFPLCPDLNSGTTPPNHHSPEPPGPTGGLPSSLNSSSSCLASIPQHAAPLPYLRHSSQAVPVCWEHSFQSLTASNSFLACRSWLQSQASPTSHPYSHLHNILS